jgi:hypothetical protein
MSGFKTSLLKFLLNLDLLHSSCLNKSISRCCLLLPNFLVLFLNASPKFLEEFFARTVYIVDTKGKIAYKQVIAHIEKESLLKFLLNLDLLHSSCLNKSISRCCLLLPNFLVLYVTWRPFVFLNQFDLNLFMITTENSKESGSSHKSEGS